jgi:hypothetical protein
MHASSGESSGEQVRTVFCCALVGVAAAAQPAQRSVTHALGDLGNVVFRARRRLVEACAVVRVLEDAVDGDRVHMWMHVDAAGDRRHRVDR